jgi:general secretion pathway protein L
MPEKIVGLDIGGKTVKAVLVTRMFGSGYRVTGAELIDIPDAGGVPEALKRIFENDAFKHAACVTSIPAKNVSFRTITLPFRDKKKIKQTITFELEPLIHYPIDDAIVDYTIVSRQDHSKIFAAVVTRSLVEERMTLLSEHVKEVSSIDLDCVSIASKLLARPEFAGCGLLLDIGDRDSVAVFVQSGTIIQVRHYAFGGDRLTTAIAKALHIEFADAEAKKKGNKIVDSKDAVSQTCLEFFTDLKNTLEFLQWQGALKEVPAKIFLTGGGAIYKDFQENLSHYFSVSVELVDISRTEGIQLDEEVKKHWEPLLMNQALSLATRKEKGAGFNFKKSDFKGKKGYVQLKGNLKKVAAIILLVLLLGGTDIYLDYHIERLRLSILKGEITAEFKKNFPEVTRIVDPVGQIKVKIAEAKKNTLGLNETASGATALDILREISSLAPASAELLITSITFENDVISMKGEAKNFNAVDTIKGELTKSKYFKTVTVGSTSLMKQADKVEFDMRIATKK